MSGQQFGKWRVASEDRAEGAREAGRGVSLGRCHVPVEGSLPLVMGREGLKDPPSDWPVGDTVTLGSPRTMGLRGDWGGAEHGGSERWLLAVETESGESF